MVKNLQLAIAFSVNSQQVICLLPFLVQNSEWAIALLKNSELRLESAHFVVHRLLALVKNKLVFTSYLLLLTQIVGRDSCKKSSN